MRWPYGISERQLHNWLADNWEWFFYELPDPKHEWLVGGKKRVDFASLDPEDDQLWIVEVKAIVKPLRGVIRAALEQTWEYMRLAHTQKGYLAGLWTYDDVLPYWGNDEPGYDHFAYVCIPMRIACQHAARFPIRCWGHHTPENFARKDHNAQAQDARWLNVGKS